MKGKERGGEEREGEERGGKGGEEGMVQKHFLRRVNGTPVPM